MNQSTETISLKNKICVSENKPQKTVHFEAVSRTNQKRNIVSKQYTQTDDDYRPTPPKREKIVWP